MGHLEVGRGRQGLMEEVATVGQGRKGLDGRHSVRGRPVWQWMDKKIELRRPGRTKWEDLAQSWVIQRRQWCLCGKQDGQETAPYCSPLFTGDRPALHQPQSCPGFPVWPGPLSPVSAQEAKTCGSIQQTQML